MNSKLYGTPQQDIAIEKSPSYFVTEIAPERVHAMNKSILLLLIVRDPVSCQFKAVLLFLMSVSSFIQCFTDLG